MARATPAAPAAATARRRPVVLAGLAALAALVAGVLLGWLLSVATGGGEAAAAPEPGSVEAIALELAEGQAQQSTALAGELAAAAEQAHGAAAAVLVGLAAVAPPEGLGAQEADTDAGTADPEGAAGWSTELDRARATLTSTGQGDDDHGVTRAALVGSLDLLGHAARTAADLPADGPAREAALVQVARDRDAAVELWQAGAARLDTLVVTGGGEHVHLFLAPDGDPDSVPQEFQEHTDD